MVKLQNLWNHPAHAQAAEEPNLAPNAFDGLEKMEARNTAEESEPVGQGSQVEEAGFPLMTLFQHVLTIEPIYIYNILPPL